jgi:hypothetical protein
MICLVTTRFGRRLLDDAAGEVNSLLCFFRGEIKEGANLAGSKKFVNGFHQEKWWT